MMQQNDWHTRGNLGRNRFKDKELTLPGPPFQKARPPSCLQIFDAASNTPRYDSWPWRAFTWRVRLKNRNFTDTATVVTRGQKTSLTVMEKSLITTCNTFTPDKRHEYYMFHISSIVLNEPSLPRHKLLMGEICYHLDSSVYITATFRRIMWVSVT